MVIPLVFINAATQDGEVPTEEIVTFDRVSRTSSTGAVFKGHYREKVAVDLEVARVCFCTGVPAPKGVRAKEGCPAMDPSTL